MRIISGKSRGTKLFTLEGLETRPTLDRVKESLFNIIQDRIQDSIVLDLFSGSGAIGLEFASRGASKVYLCDNSKEAAKIINSNIEKTHLQEKVSLYNMDFKDVLQKVKEIKFDIIFLDPPYKTSFIKEALEQILNYDCIKKDSLIIVETDEEERITSEIKNLNVEFIDKRKYGRAHIIFIQKRWYSVWNFSRRKGLWRYLPC